MIYLLYSWIGVVLSYPYHILGAPSLGVPNPFPLVPRDPAGPGPFGPAFGPKPAEAQISDARVVQVREDGADDLHEDLAGKMSEGASRASKGQIQGSCILIERPKTRGIPETRVVGSLCLCECLGL